MALTLRTLRYGDVLKHWLIRHCHVTNNQIPDDRNIEMMRIYDFIQHVEHLFTKMLYQF